MENLKIKRKKDNKFWTSRALQSGDLNPRFSVIFPHMIWIFMESEGDEIKSKQASKKDRTLLSYEQSVQPSKSLKAVLLLIPFNKLPLSTLTHHKDISDCNFPSSLGVFCGNFCYLLCANPWPNYVHCTLVPVGLLSFYLGGSILVKCFSKTT